VTTLAVGGRAFVNAVFNVGGTVFGIAVWFVLTPFVVSRLGRVDYSIWVLFFAVSGYAPLVGLGIGDALTRAIATAANTEERSWIGNLLCGALWFYGVVAVLILAATAALAPHPQFLLHVPRSSAGTEHDVLVLTGIYFAALLVASVPLAVLRGLQRFDLINAVVAVSVLVSAGVYVVVLLLGGGVVQLVAAVLVLELVVQVPFVVVIRRVAPWLHAGGLLPTRETMRVLVTYGSARSLIRLGTVVRSRSDELILGALAPIGAIGPYALCRRFAVVRRSGEWSIRARSLFRSGGARCLRAKETNSKHSGPVAFLRAGAPAEVHCHRGHRNSMGPAQSNGCQDTGMAGENFR